MNWDFSTAKASRIAVWPRSHLAWLTSLAIGLLLAMTTAVQSANVPPGFTETAIPGPGGGGAWNEAVGVTFNEAGRMFVWERAGRIWFKDPADSGFTQLLDISEEVGVWDDHGCVGFALDPNFQANGFIYLLYAVDRHHLLYFGTPTYNSSSNLTFDATIGRLTRYTCVASNDFKSVNPASRFVMLGDSITNGIPICSGTHGVGSLEFGEDGTLLVSCGEGASPASVDLGGATAGSYAPQAVADGILKAKENVGMYRSQLIDCLNGKILRLDPATGNGVPSNPYFDPAKPKSARSRVWTLGLRNPFRMSRRPETGSHDPADANPGVLYAGEVGWDTWESLKVITGSAQNMGWPVFEGVTATPAFAFGGGSPADFDVYNLDAPNPLSGGSCNAYFSFRQLIKQASTAPADQPPFNNPCTNSGLKISTNIPQFLHTRPVLDWNHTSAITRTPTYNGSGQATFANVGAGGSPVSGTQFQGNCAAGGTWYTANSFPTQYQNTYFFADWGQGVIKNLVLTTNNTPVALNHFADAAGAVVCIAPHPADGSIYYVSYSHGDAGTVRKISYTGNRTPVAVASSDKTYGPGPLTVQFNGSGSSDPDAQAITYSWNFGDGSALSTAANPLHVFTPPNSNAAPYTVTLTVTDTGSLTASASLLIVANDTPPVVTITTPTNGSLYSIVSNTPFNLIATVSDAESADAQLAYKWETLLRHNAHVHLVNSSTNHISSTLVEPIGCDGVNIYHYRIVLTVTDPAGLKTVREVGVFPDCGSTDTPPTLTDIPNQSVALGGATAAIPFTLGDAQVLAANLQLSVTSSNLALVPLNNIVFGGSGAARTVTVTPAAGLTGTSLITVTVNDGPNNVSDTFLITVTGSNLPPTISSIANQSTGDGTATAPNPFIITDPNTPSGSLSLSGFAANTNLLPNANISFGGSGSNRTVTVTPAPGQLGSTLITIVVSDGQLNASNSYTLTVTAQTAATLSFTNSATITIPDSGAATPYPSTLNVTGLGGTITNVTVTLRNFTHSWASDVDALLVGPGGQAMVVMSDAADGPINNANNVTLTFSDGAAAFLPASGILATGTYRPTDIALGAADSYPGPAPAGPYATNFATFNGTSANGIWSLYVLDDGPGDLGSFAGGWSITITTVTNAVSNTPPTISAITNQITTVNTPETAVPFTIGDAQTAASNLVLTALSANLTLVPSNNIVFGGTGANRTVTITPASNQLGTATITLIVSDGTLSASNSFVQTVNPAVLTVTENSATRSYGVTNPVLTGSVAGLQAGDVITASFTSAAVTNSPIGAYPIAVTLSDPGSKLGNYIVTTNNGTLTVTNAPLTVTENSASRSYGATNPVLSGSVTGLRAGDVVTASFTTTAATNSPVGAYPITFVLTDPGARLGNYFVTTNNGTLTVTQAPLLVKASNTNKVYRTVLTFSGGEFAIIGGALVNGNTLTNVSLSSPGTGKGAKVGAYPITASAAQGLGLTNYSITYSNGVLTVGPTNLTIAATSQSKPYGTSLALPTNGFTTTEMEDGDSVTNVTLDSTGAAGTAPAGVYAITPTNATGVGLTNYIIAYSNGTLSVGQAQLIATADDKSRAYGQPNPAFTINFSGFVNGEGTNVLNSLPLASTTATSTTAPGSYPITLAGGTDDNYSFTLVSGALSISPPGDITITTVEVLDADNVRIAGTGDANVTYTVQKSSDLVTWETLGTTTADGGGVFEFVDSTAGASAQRFYRLATP